MHCILRYWHSKLQVSHKLTLSFCFPTWLDVALFLKLNSRGHSLQPSEHPSCFNQPKERVKLHKFTHKLTLHMCFIFPLSFLRLFFKSHSLTHCLAKPWLYIHLILLLSKIEDTHCIPNPKHVGVHCFSLLRWRFSRFLLFFFFLITEYYNNSRYSDTSFDKEYVKHQTQQIFESTIQDDDFKKKKKKKKQKSTWTIDQLNSYRSRITNRKARQNAEQQTPRHWISNTNLKQKRGTEKDR